VTQSSPLDTLSDQGRRISELELDQVAALVVPNLLHHADTFGKQARCHQDHDGGGNDGTGNPDPGELEHADPGHSPALHEAVHDQVGGGADQRADAADDGRIGERNQQLRRRDP
jgi:hypothetical protein